MTPYPGWGIFIGVLFTLVTILPIVVTVLHNLATHPGDWARGFAMRFSNLADYLPDPSLLDSSRRKTMKEVEDYLREEGVIEMTEKSEDKASAVENQAVETDY